jgi:hypothetical protein
MYIEGTGFYIFKECHKTESLQNYTATAHKERERLGDRRNVGESSCNSGDGTGQMAQPVIFMIMIFCLTTKQKDSPYLIVITTITGQPLFGWILGSETLMVGS